MVHFRSVVACISLLHAIKAVDTNADLTYSKYEGAALPSGVSQWLGTRYAAPPVGSLRFMPPEDPPQDEDPQIADEEGLNLTREYVACG